MPRKRALSKRRWRWGCLGKALLAVSLLLAAALAYHWTLIRNPLLLLSKLVILRNERIQDGPLTHWWGDLVRTVEVVGNIAYVGLGTRMGVVDVADPHNPRLLHAVNLQGIVHGYAVRNNILYCAHGASGMSTFDISDPAHPVRLGQLAFPGYGMHVAVLGDDFVLFSNEVGGWYILDVRDPSNPIPVSHTSGGWVSAARVFGNTAYILNGYVGVEIYDVSSPQNPTPLRIVPIHLPPGEFVIDPPPIWLELQDGYAYVSNGSDGLRVIDVRNPRGAEAVGHLPLDSFSYTVAVRGNRAYMANLTLGLVVIDISNPLAPRTIRNIPTPGNAYDIIFRGDLGYVSDGANGFMILDFSDPDYPREVGYFQVPARTRGVTRAGDRLVTSDVGHGIRIFDIGSPAAPVLLGHVETPGLAREAVIDGDTIYVVDVLGGFQKIDASNPRAPRIASTFALEEHPWGIAGEGHHLYCAMGSHGFSIFDTRSNPPAHIFNYYESEIPDVRPQSGASMPGGEGALPALPARRAGKGYSVEAAKAGNLAFTGDVILGLAIFDVGNPANARLMGRYTMDPWNDPLGFLRRGGVTTVVGTFAEEQRVYLAGYDRGLEIVNVTDPSRPVREGHLPVGGHSYGIWKQGEQVCLATHEGKLFLIDVSSPTQPRLKGELSLPGELQDVVCDDRIAYVAAGTEGLLVVDLETKQHTTFPVR